MNRSRPTAQEPRARSGRRSRWILGVLLLGVGAANCKVRVAADAPQYGNGEFACFESEECPLPETPCLLAMCLDDQCVHVPAPQGPLPLEDQAEGDCTLLYCDGNGGIASYPSQADTPPEDDNPCTEAICDIQQPAHAPLPPGSVCGDAKICTGTGVCGVCLPADVRCEGNGLTVCDAQGQWPAASACAASEPLCHDATCVGVAEVAVGGDHACARFDNGGVYCWGSDANGQLGSGERGAGPGMPPELLANTVWGPQHACALGAGQALCWGANDYGQLGDETFVSRLQPQLAKLSEVRQIALGSQHSCALRNNGEVWCWGRHDRGQLGRASGTPLAAANAANAASPADPNVKRAAAQPLALEKATALQLGPNFTCAAAAGTSCWGFRNPLLPAAITTPDDLKPDQDDPVAERQKLASWTPAAVADVSAAAQIAAGHDFSCARLSDGHVSCWGAGEQGQLGGGPQPARDVAKPVPGLAAVRHIGLGSAYACALDDGGKVWCWGAGSAVRPLPALPPTASLHVGTHLACSLGRDRRVRCWRAAATATDPAWSVHERTW